MADNVRFKTEYLESLNEIDLIRLTMLNQVHDHMTRQKRIGLYKRLNGREMVVQLDQSDCNLTQ